MFAASIARMATHSGIPQRKTPHRGATVRGQAVRREWGQNPGAVNPARHQKGEQQTFARVLSRSRRCSTTATNINEGVDIARVQVLGRDRRRFLRFHEAYAGSVAVFRRRCPHILADDLSEIARFGSLNPRN